MTHPKNVAAILEWYRQHRPDLLPEIKAIFATTDRQMDRFAALLLQGFEAGREFEKANPTVESGIGYVP